MSQLQVTPPALADAAGTLDAEQESMARAAWAIGAATDGIATALPGSRTAAAAESTGAALAAAVRSAAAELALLATALGAAAREYVAVEQDAATGLERAGRRPS
jgi:hypothetical protein